MPTALPSLMLAAALCGPAPAPELPPVSLDDLTRFPSYELASFANVFAAAHVERLKKRWPGIGFIDRENIEAEIEASKACQGVWELLWSAHGHANGRLSDRPWWIEGHWSAQEYALYQLERLRHALGPANYYQGWMPPPVPVWYFRRVD